MKRLLVILVTLLAAAPAAASASFQPRPVSTIYDLYLGGIKAGEMTFDAAYDGADYTATSVLRTAGVVGFFYKASFEAETRGRLSGAALAPDRFAAASRMKSKEQYVEMHYKAGRPARIAAEPAFIPKPWEIEPTEQLGTLDPITAALSALSPAPMGEVCNRSVEVFDGRRRYAVDLGPMEPDGNRMRCPATYRRIAGFKPKMMKKQAEFPFNVWFEQRPDGLAQFVRAAGESMFGLAVILLRK